MAEDTKKSQTEAVCGKEKWPTPPPLPRPIVEDTRKAQTEATAALWQTANPEKLRVAVIVQYNDSANLERAVNRWLEDNGKKVKVFDIKFGVNEKIADYGGRVPLNNMTVLYAMIIYQPVESTQVQPRKEDQPDQNDVEPVPGL